MKLIIAVVHDKDAGILSDALAEAGIQGTKLASTGGFLHEGNTTFFIGVKKERVEEVLNIIRDNCQARSKIITPLSPVGNAIDSIITYPTEIQIGGATIFVLDVEQFIKI